MQNVVGFMPKPVLSVRQQKKRSDSFRTVEIRTSALLFPEMNAVSTESLVLVANKVVCSCETPSDIPDIYVL